MRVGMVTAALKINVKNVELSGAARKFRVESFPAMQALHEHAHDARRAAGTNRGVKA